MLKRIEYEQDTPPPERGENPTAGAAVTGFGDPERVTDRRPHELRRRGTAEWHDESGVPVIGRLAPENMLHEPCLSDSARTEHRHEP